MDGYLLPSDADWPEEKRLMADLSHVNTEISRYIFNLLDVDAGRGAPLSVEDEHRLGQKFIELGERLQRRAARRESENNGHVIEDGSAQPLQLDPPQKPQTDTGP